MSNDYLLAESETGKPPLDVDESVTVSDSFVTTHPAVTSVWFVASLLQYTLVEAFIAGCGSIDSF